MKYLEICLCENLIGNIKRNWFKAIRIDTSARSHSGINVFVRVDAFGGMKVEGCLEIALMELLDELLWFWEEFFLFQV